MAIVYCENYKCPFNEKLQEPIHFQFRKGYYKAFEGDVCKGHCTKEELLVSSTEFQNKDTLMEYACCIEAENENKMQ